MPETKSIALQYNTMLPAPFVVAKGKGELAGKLLRLAQEHGVRVVRQEELAESLFLLEVNEFIPERFYAAVAEILAYVLASSGRAGASMDHGKGVHEEHQGE